MLTRRSAHRLSLVHPRLALRQRERTKRSPENEPGSLRAGNPPSKPCPTRLYSELAFHSWFSYHLIGLISNKLVTLAPDYTGTNKTTWGARFHLQEQRAQTPFSLDSGSFPLNKKRVRFFLECGIFLVRSYPSPPLFFLCERGACLLSSAIFYILFYLPLIYSHPPPMLLKH